MVSRGSGEGCGAALRQRSGSAGQGGWQLTADVGEIVAVWSGLSAALQTHKAQINTEQFVKHGNKRSHQHKLLLKALQNTKQTNWEYIS